jgi:hypothetical protein
MLVKIREDKEIGNPNPTKTALDRKNDETRLKSGPRELSPSATPTLYEII